MNERLTLDVNGAVGVVTLCAPEAGNAIDQTFCNEFLEATHVLAGDARIRSVLLRSTGRFFCVGGNVSVFSTASDLGKLTLELTAPLHTAVARLIRLSKPIVTAVNGPAAGAGLGLALLGDVVFACKAASFTFAYPRIGLSPDAGVSFLLPRLVGLRRAQEMLFLERSLKGDEAAEWGLITRCVADDVLADETFKIAERLAAMPTNALGRSKQLLWEAMNREVEVQLENEARCVSQCASEPNAREGVAAFLERRPAKFS